MTTDAGTMPQGRGGGAGRALTAAADRVLPVASVIALILIVWYGAAILMNGPQVLDRFQREGVTPTNGAVVAATYAMERPVLPAPHQIAAEFADSVFGRAITSKRSLVYHGWVTLSATLTGFAFGVVLGLVLAIGIVEVRALDKSLMPWVIASQTIPILAIAPMIVVIFGAVGLTGLVPKAVISMYLSFFPVTIGMVKGLRAPDRLQLDLMRTYSATPRDVLLKLRLPAATPYLFSGLKIAIAIALVGAVVAELPTGATAGIGARLLSGSYYGQTIQIWAALLMAALIGVGLTGIVALIEQLTLKAMGARP